MTREAEVDRDAKLLRQGKMIFKQNIIVGGHALPLGIPLSNLQHGLGNAGHCWLQYLLKAGNP